MKLGIIGAILLLLGLLSLYSWWWIFVDVIKGLIVVALVISGALALAIAVRKASREKTPAE